MATRVVRATRTVRSTRGTVKIEAQWWGGEYAEIGVQGEPPQEVLHFDEDDRREFSQSHLSRRLTDWIEQHGQAQIVTWARTDWR